jgi:hypothetical protein
MRKLLRHTKQMQLRINRSQKVHFLELLVNTLANQRLIWHYFLRVSPQQPPTLEYAAITILAAFSKIRVC